MSKLFNQFQQRGILTGYRESAEEDEDDERPNVPVGAKGHVCVFSQVCKRSFLTGYRSPIPKSKSSFFRQSLVPRCLALPASRLRRRLVSIYKTQS